MTKNRTDPVLQALIQLARSILLFVVVGAAPLAIFQTLTHAIQPSTVFGLYGSLLPVWYTLLVLLVLLRIVTPVDMTKTKRTVRGFERALNIVFCTMSALFFALFLFLFVLATRDTLTPPQRIIDVFVTFVLSSANVLAFGWLVRHFAAPLLPNKAVVSRRSFSDWFFDTVELVIRRLQKLPFVSH